MSKFRPVTNEDGSPYGIRFDCPGCKDPHVIPTVGPKAWGFNGSMDKPTLTPSILVRGKDWDYDAPDEAARLASIRDVVCHSFVTDGRIQFLGDCTHDLKGQTVDLPEYVTP